MKRIFSIIGIAFALSLIIVFATSSGQNVGRREAEAAQADASRNAQVAVPIPVVSYFQEKRTIAKWTERWDKPSIVTYVYLVSFGQILGYYVVDGKPASTRSYLMPEESYYSNGATLSNPDIDGTWGENNPGIRFFTAEGAAVWDSDPDIATFLVTNGHVRF